MINLLIEECDRDLAAEPPPPLEALEAGDQRALARWITCIEADALDPAAVDALRSAARPASARRCSASPAPADRESRRLTDELIRRFRLDQEDKLSIAVLAVDPTRRQGGGALLGDRIRMNAIDAGNVFFRSLATRGPAVRDARPVRPRGGGLPRPPGSAWSSSRRLASGRVTPRSPTSPMSPST